MVLHQMCPSNCPLTLLPPLLHSSVGSRGHLVCTSLLLCCYISEQGTCFSMSPAALRPLCLWWHR